MIIRPPTPKATEGFYFGNHSLTQSKHPHKGLPDGCGDELV